MRRVVLFLVLLVLVGCASERGVAKAPPRAAAPSPVVEVAGQAQVPEAVPSTVTSVVTRGDPVMVVEGPSSENAFYAPVSLALRDDRFDLIVHFHGKHQTAIDALEQSGLPVAMVSVDFGVGSMYSRSTHYRDVYEDSAALDDLVSFAERELQRSGRVSGARVGRIAISAWSAGYGAVREILGKPSGAARVDALLLVDGFYADWENKRAKKVARADLDAAMTFARRAKAGEKLFVLTHTAIDSPTYAAGPNAADVLLRFLDVEKGPARGGQRPNGGAPEYAVDVEGLHVMGFNGKKWSDHVEQHRTMGAVHYAELRKHWLPATAKE